MGKRSCEHCGEGWTGCDKDDANCPVKGKPIEDVIKHLIERIVRLESGLADVENTLGLQGVLEM